MGDRIFEITPQIRKYTELARVNDTIAPELYAEHQVMRGLRDLNGTGVVTGLTSISEVYAKEVIDGKRVPCPGELYYRGYNVKDLIHAAQDENRFVFEEAAYLLLNGELPTRSELDEFIAELSSRRTLPANFTRDVIMKAPTRDIMVNLAKCVLALYAYDDKPTDLSLDNVMRQCLNLIAIFPRLVIHSYHAYRYVQGDSLYIHQAKPELSTAENILHMLRADMRYTPFEAATLDMALLLHMEHGGGNNSTFTTRVVTSSGSDTYSTIAAAIGSLKGPKHGGANVKVMEMFDDIKEHVGDWADEDEVTAYLEKILAGEAFDRTGLIYGIGHAIYSVSDPRAEIFREYVGRLAEEKGRVEEYRLYETVARKAPEIISGNRKMYKGVNTNVDFYSGFVYNMLGLPEELYTPFFAVARIVGWSAHRLEELVSAEKIIRPAYIETSERRAYTKIEDR